MRKKESCRRFIARITNWNSWDRDTDITIFHSTRKRFLGHWLRIINLIWSHVRCQMCICYESGGKIGLYISSFVCFN
ncbi:unnamed protein product [Rhizophagus irregularis]|nr:unnamed protein product [Rhizophagus irregularis]